MGEIYDETDSSEWIEGLGSIVKREPGVYDVDAKTVRDPSTLNPKPESLPNEDAGSCDEMRQRTHT